MPQILGIFVANFIFATQLAEYDLWRNSFNFWMAYACLVLIWPILLLLRDRFGNILATSVVGSYCFLFGVDFFVASSFDDMLVNAFKRATVPSFSVDYSGNYFADAFNGCSDVALSKPSPHRRRFDRCCVLLSSADSNHPALLALALNPTLSRCGSFSCLARTMTAIRVRIDALWSPTFLTPY